MFVRLRNPTLLKIKKKSSVSSVKIKTIYTICMRQGYICDRVRNRKNHFETFLILKEELQEWEIQMKTKTKHMSLAGKCNISLNFPSLNTIPCSIGRKAGNSNNYCEIFANL